MRVLAVSGSLRARSSNAALLRAAAALAPPGLTITFCDGIEDLPQFNPDDDEEGAVPHPAVAHLRGQFRAAEGFIISAPEYAAGLPGSLKNALDWLVSSGELMEKPVLLLNASPIGARKAQASLAGTLMMMSATVLEDSLLDPFVTPGNLADPATASALAAAMRSLADAMNPQ